MHYKGVLRYMKKFFCVLIGLFILISSFSFAQEEVELPVIGTIIVDEMPLFLSTILIATADGFNPCSIWVLLFLLGIIIHTGSRKKIALVGGVFLLVTATIYGLFIASVFTLLDILNHISWLIYFVAIVALIFGLVNVKDYFWFKKGLSFTISDKHKPGFYKKVRNLLKIDSNYMLIGVTAIMAAGIAIIELPCTAGLPVIWSSLLVSSGIQTGFIGYLLLYLFTYLLIEILIIITVLITLRSFKMTEFKGRVLKLIGGILIISLALVLLIDRTIMYNITWAFVIIFGSMILSVVIIIIERFLQKK